MPVRGSWLDEPEPEDGSDPEAAVVVVVVDPEVVVGDTFVCGVVVAGAVVLGAVFFVGALCFFGFVVLEPSGSWYWSSPAPPCAAAAAGLTSNAALARRAGMRRERSIAPG
jgi:hypothetical protein